MKIIAVRGDITEVNVDAVVNPMDAKEGRLVRALLDRGGSEVEAEATGHGPIQVGEAIITTGGNLKCKYVIHAPVGEAEKQARPDGVRQSTRAALRCAAGGRLRSVAIAALTEDEGTALVTALRDFDREEGPSDLTEVFIVGEDGEVVSSIKRFINTGN